MSLTQCSGMRIGAARGLRVQSTAVLLCVHVYALVGHAISAMFSTASKLSEALVCCCSEQRYRYC
jgi:hypothetical protein